MSTSLCESSDVGLSRANGSDVEDDLLSTLFRRLRDFAASVRKTWHARLAKRTFYSVEILQVASTEDHEVVRGHPEDGLPLLRRRRARGERGAEPALVPKW